MAIIDLSKVSVMNFLPEGESVATIVKQEMKTSKEKGTPMVEVTFRNRRGQEDRQHFVLSDKALFRLKTLAVMSGLSEAQTNSTQFDTAWLVGRSVLVIKTKKGMRQIVTDQGHKDVPEYDFQFGKAEGATAPAAGPASSGSTPSDVMNAEDIPF